MLELVLELLEHQKTLTCKTADLSQKYYSSISLLMNTESLFLKKTTSD